MPFVNSNGIRLHYELQGKGDPVLFIGGLGADTFLWWRQVPAFCQEFQVITFDNRGAGESDKPEEPYTIPMFAQDTAGLLKALGIPRAHIVGGSLGGFIAQEFAILYPRIVNKLVLMSTAFGGPNMVPAPRETMAALVNRTGDPETDIRSGFALFTSEDWRKEQPQHVDAYVKWRVAHPQPLAAYQRQAMASASHNAEDRVQQITAPTLIAHGRDDRIVPAENAHRMYHKIPNSRLMIFPAGHAFNIELADDFNRAVIAFLKEG